MRPSRGLPVTGTLASSPAGRSPRHRACRLHQSGVERGADPNRAKAGSAWAGRFCCRPSTVAPVVSWVLPGTPEDGKLWPPSGEGRDLRSRRWCHSASHGPPGSPLLRSGPPRALSLAGPALVLGRALGILLPGWAGSARSRRSRAASPSEGGGDGTPPAWAAAWRSSGVTSGTLLRCRGGRLGGLAAPLP